MVITLYDCGLSQLIYNLGEIIFFFFLLAKCPLEFNIDKETDYLVVAQFTSCYETLLKGLF